MQDKTSPLLYKASELFGFLLKIKIKTLKICHNLLKLANIFIIIYNNMLTKDKNLFNQDLSLLIYKIKLWLTLYFWILILSHPNNIKLHLF